MYNLNLIKTRKIYLIFSSVLVIVSLFFLFTRGLNYGIDFTGGNLYQLKFEQNLDKTKVNQVLSSLESEFPALKGRKEQISEENVLILRTASADDSKRKELLEQLESKLGKLTLEKEDTVGPSIGSELKSNALKALIIGSILIVIYITIRFELIYAIGAIVALLHDVIITAGFIALLRLEIDTPFIAAILTILGYSINDTIVTYDRIRENDKESSGEEDFGEIIDKSVNQVFVRSINTSFTTMLAVLALLLFGGDTLRTFNTTLFVGIFIGTYSSIFLASPIVYMLRGFRRKHGEEKQKEDMDDDKIVV